jgi:hypothetical protein
LISKIGMLVNIDEPARLGVIHKPKHLLVVHDRSHGHPPLLELGTQPIQVIEYLVGRGLFIAIPTIPEVNVDA